MFEKPKRSGGTRVIHAPYWPLLNIQRKLLALLEELYRPSPRVMGFVKGRGIRQNASMHLGKRLILNIDLENYFPSIHFGRVRGRLLAAPYSLTNDIATTIAKLCTLDEQLPIGAPTSPILANMVSSSLDGELTRLAREHGCFYSRYADDITISTNRRNFPPAIVAANPIGGVVELGAALTEAVTVCGFAINTQKSRVLAKTSRQEVCGVTINVRLNTNRRLLREVRAILHAWQKFGKSGAEAV
jgi:RNA-directed DNA polymerase